MKTTQKENALSGINDVLLNIITSGKPIDVRDGRKMIIIGRYTLLNFLVFMAVLLLVLFFALDGQSGNIYIVPIIGILAVIIGTSFCLARTSVPFALPAALIVSVYWLFCVVMTQAGIAGISSVIWAVALPPMAVFLLGNRFGSAVSLSLLAAMAAVIKIPQMNSFEYPIDYLIRIASAYLFIFSMMLVINRSSQIRNALVYELTHDIQAERDEMETMKDNLKTGVFLLDENYTIQPYYSRALTDILEAGNLEGMNFIDILKNSLQKKEAETLKDYFDMVIQQSFNSKMLEDINPLHQFTYNTPTGTQKILFTTFVQLQHSESRSQILCTIDDRTREAELEQQLSEEDSRRQEEMETFFEVVHVDPRVLNDFIEETDMEFERTNSVLKNKSLPAKKIMLELYQGVHAIKSNATIIGLNSFAGKLHLLEEKIREFTNKEENSITFQDVLHVMLELDILMKINDNLRGIIDKIKSFSLNEQRVQSTQVLVQTLERAISRICSDTGKQAVLSVKQLDLGGIGSSQRRVIKEVLVQLVRNSLYHGIETPEARRANNKNECGSIMLSIVIFKNENKIRVQLTDDGAGIDFNAVSHKAQKNKLINDPAKLSDRNALAKVLFMPGFSTAAEAGMHAGRGVGLNLVYDRIKEADGTIQLQTETNKGTVFTIELPYKSVE